MDSTLLSIESLHVNIFGQEVLHDVSMEIKAGEQWAIFGAAGTGKTVFGHTLAGNHVFQGRIVFSGLPETGHVNRVKVVDQQHRFHDLQNQTNFYYQQRYNAYDSQATMTVADDLSVFAASGFGRLPWADLLETFHLAPLLNQPLIQLSNGENKRLQILKAVLGFHLLLILDEPFTGLDVEGRRILDEILSVLSDSGQPLILLSNRDHLPACFNRYARLQNGYLTVMENPEDILIKRSDESRPPLKEFPSSLSFSYPDFRHAVRMQQVHIQYGEKNILEGINWEVDRGACWALTGHNGAGKSTLLSLITGDNPQAYANDIYLFDRKRGSGESIWEIKQKIGYLSPELHLYFDPAATAFTALASGLFDTIGLFRQLSPLQEQGVWEWLQFLDCLGYANRLMISLPTGIQRLILLGRAMIKTPPLLILDEPCQGLDIVQTAFTLQTIDRYCDQYGASLIYVCHYSADFPSCINKHLQLEKGKIA